MKWPSLIILPVIIGGLIWTFSHPFGADDVVTLAGLALLTSQYLVIAYFHITRMREDDKGRFHYTVAGWFMDVVLRIPSKDGSEPMCEHSSWILYRNRETDTRMLQCKKCKKEQPFDMEAVNNS